MCDHMHVATDTNEPSSVSHRSTHQIKSSKKTFGLYDDLICELIDKPTPVSGHAPTRVPQFSTELATGTADPGVTVAMRHLISPDLIAS